MGTNFYLTLNECDKCGRFDELHIGKASAGWQFLWQGFNPQEWEIEENPDVRVIRSVKDWIPLLEKGVIHDGRGSEVSVGELLEIVDKKRDRDLLNNTEYLQKHHGYISEDDAWNDEDGHPFSGRDFS